MKRKSALNPVLIPALLAAVSVCGYILRRLALKGASALPVILLSAAASVLLLLAALGLAKRSAFSDVFRPDTVDLVFSLLGAAFIAAGGIATLAGSSGRWLGAAALLAAAALAYAALGRMAGRAPQPAAYVLPVLFYVVKLFYDFRHWMVDPAILDYCFLLFALISFMLASYQAGSFAFDRGRRSALAFFSMTGVYFGCVSLAGASAASALLYGGSTLWMLVCAWQATSSHPAKKA